MYGARGACVARLSLHGFPAASAHKISAYAQGAEKLKKMLARF